MYTKSLNWYISRATRQVLNKIEKKINAKGIPKVKVYSKTARESVQIIIDAPFYADIQDQGVKGKHSGHSNSGYKFKNKPPPTKAFERYTSDKRGQYAIARSVFNKGLKPKKYIKATIGHYSPQLTTAVERGIDEYINDKFKQIVL